jgi:cystathionine gamma-synthase
MERAEENAKALVDWLLGQKHVKRVLYPGLKSHPGYEIMKKQCRGFGAMVTFDVDTPEFAVSLLEHVKLIRFAESLGGTETLLTYPVTQTHADVPKEDLARNGITDTTLRLSVGIEGIKDLIADFEQAFAVSEGK